MASNMPSTLGPDLMRRLGERATTMGVPMAALTRAAITEYLNRLDQAPAPLPTQQLYVARMLCEELKQVLDREPAT